MEIFVTNQKIGTTRRAMLHGREHIVAPLTLIVPGVLSGSKGALLYPHDEISKDPSVWNGTPIVVYHPTRSGMHVSARDPDVLDKQGIGVVMRSSAKGKLTAEGWFDVEATRRVDPRVLASLEAGNRIELSTGLYTENEPANGTFNGKPYDHIARNYRPDHLAILPDQVGACSVKDGCGVMVNKAPTNNCECDWSMVVNTKTKKSVKTTKDWQPLTNCGDMLPMVGVDDDGSYVSTDARVRKAFREANPTQFDSATGERIASPYVVSVFEDHLIFRDGLTLGRVSWSMSDGEVVIGDEPQRVQKVVDYVPVDNADWGPVDNCGGKGGTRGPCPGKGKRMRKSGSKVGKKKSAEIDLNDYVRKGPKKFGTFTRKNKDGIKTRSNEDTGSFRLSGRNKAPMMLSIK